MRTQATSKERFLVGAPDIGASRDAWGLTPVLWSSQRTMTDTTLHAGGWGYTGDGPTPSISDPVPPWVCRAEEACQSCLDAPSRSAHTAPQQCL